MPRLGACVLVCASLASAELQLLPLPSFGAEVRNLHVSDLVRRSRGSESEQASAQEDVRNLHRALHNERLLAFRGLGSLPWEDQLAFTTFFGTVFNESAHSNRAPHPAAPDPHIAVFSNDPANGSVSAGTEGWHVDGNVVRLPHAVTLIHAISVIPDGDTIFVPLQEVVHLLRERGHLSGRCKERAPPCLGNFSMPAEQAFKTPPLDDVLFQSGHVKDVRHPLIYPHPVTGHDTMMFGLGQLSGKYRRGCLQPALPSSWEMSHDETETAMQAILDAIESSRKTLRWRWASGDLIMVDNLAVAHYASEGTQASPQQVGLRLMQRTTVAGTTTPQKRPLLHSLPHECISQDPAAAGPPSSNHYCVFSLPGPAAREAPGAFDSREAARGRCRSTLAPDADLAIPATARINEAMGRVVSAVGAPHWLGGDDSPNGHVQWLDGSIASDGWGFDSSLPWHAPSGQPNDCDGPGTETCMFMGPGSKWFDFACQPKVANATKGVTPGPEINWHGDGKHMYNIHALCGLYLRDNEATKLGLRMSA